MTTSISNPPRVFESVTELVGKTPLVQIHSHGAPGVEIFAKLEAGELPPEDIQRYTAEVRRLFNKREYSLDPAVDARLSFTTDIGYRPHGHLIPGWKAVFFHPQTDEAVIDRLVWSIEEMI